jgi:hypothetical protein
VTGRDDRASQAGVSHLVTRDVEPSALRDLVAAPPRATVAFADRGVAELLPVKVAMRDGAYLFGIAAAGAPALDGRDVVLLMDGGSYWFELRGVSVRGMASRADAPDAAAGAWLCWYAVEPRRVLAWDYAYIRET